MKGERAVSEEEYKDLENDVSEEEVHISDEVGEDAESDVTEVEENDEVVGKAKKYGHLSKEEWVAAGRDPAQWKSPEEFNKTGEVIEQIYSLKKRIEQRDRELQAVIEYQKRTEQRAIEKAKQDLQQQIAASKDDMDVEKVAHYTKELTRLEDQENQVQANHMQQAQKAAQDAFIERNQHWFNDRNSDMVNRAIEIDQDLKRRLPNASYEDLADMIEAKMMKEYPERVLDRTRSVRPNVSSVSSVNKTAVGTTSVRKTFQSLSQEHKDTYNVYKRINPNVTEAEFIQKLKDDGEI